MYEVTQRAKLALVHLDSTYNNLNNIHINRLCSKINVYGS